MPPPPKHALVHQTSYKCLSTAFRRSVALHEDSCSYTRLYKGDLASPPRYDSLFPHFSQFPSHSHFLHRLGRWSANMCAGTFHSTMKTHRHCTEALSATVVSISSSLRKINRYIWIKVELFFFTKIKLIIYI